MSLLEVIRSFDSRPSLHHDNWLAGMEWPSEPLLSERAFLGLLCKLEQYPELNCYIYYRLNRLLFRRRRCFPRRCQLEETCNCCRFPRIPIQCSPV